MQKANYTDVLGDVLNVPLKVYVYVATLATLAAVSSYMRKVQVDGMSQFSWAELGATVVIGGFVGFTTFNLCQAYGVPGFKTGAAVGVSAHMGIRAITIIELVFERALAKLLKKVGKDDENQ